MTYFRNFPRVFYKFGNETTADAFENITIYSDVIDKVRDLTSAYQDYYVLPGERPDQVSQKLYGTPRYHWTFYLMNKHLRDSGWPLAPQKVFEKAQKDYKDTVLTTKTLLTDRFKVGQTISGLTSGITATITHREVDLGQVWIKGATGSFTIGEQINSTDTDGNERSIFLDSSTIQYNAVHHYENSSKEYVDIDPTVGPGSGLLPITWLDRLEAKNNEQREIRVLRDDTIDEVAKAFRDALKF
tara:strand:- start:629 stop:1357 length:729 start_codon:yes stop_codon:yes gene_type:complete